MTLFAWSTLSSGCAASIPWSASVTTSSGALISFFMSSDLPSGSSVRSRSGRRNSCGGELRLRVAQVDTGLGHLAVGRRTGDQPERVGGGDTGEQLGAQVDGDLVPLHTAAGELLDEHRTERARRVDRRARSRRDRDDRREDDQTDGDAGEAGGGLAVDDAEDREHQDEGADELSREGLRPADVGVARNPQTDVACLVPEDAEDRGGTEYGARTLRRDVRRHLRPGELPGRRQPERHRRVDVIAADVAEGVDSRHDDGAEGEGD